jgi:hypothetical protein
MQWKAEYNNQYKPNQKNRKAKECKEYIDIDKQKKAASVVAFREAYDEFPIISSVLSLFYVWIKKFQKRLKVECYLDVSETVKKRTKKDNLCNLIFKYGGTKHKAKTPIEANFLFQFVFSPLALRGNGSF